MVNSMLPLTARQQKLLDYLRSCERCPSFIEMRDALGIRSQSYIHRLLSALEERGYISRLKNRARAITLHDPVVPLVRHRRSPLSEYLLTELLNEAIRRTTKLEAYLQSQDDAA